MALTRRDVLSASLAAPALLAMTPTAWARDRGRGQEGKPEGAAVGPVGGPVVIASANGVPAVERAYAMLVDGADPADAVVAGVARVEDDPDDLTVGLGGLPNEAGVVQLDASVMHGPTHKSGAVAAIENIRNPAAVALLVLKRTDHCLIVGEGAKRFALAHGFKEEDLLTDRSRAIWLRWKANMSKDDDWLNDEEMDWDPKDPMNSGPGPIGARQQADKEFERLLADHDVRWVDGVPHATGTIHCSAVDGRGDLASCTTTSGLSWKIPGRVGDSPITGAGMYCDNDVGAAGATGRGEAVILNCGAFAIVRAMERGLTPSEACLEVAGDIVRRTKEKRLRDASGRVNFNVLLYAVRKDGAYGAASIMPGGRYAVCDAKGARVEACASVYGA